jgi:hypothetical protein
MTSRQATAVAEAKARREAKGQQAEQPQPEAEQPKTIEQMQAELKAAREAEKLLKQQLQAAREATRAAADTRTKLERVIDRQHADNGGKWLAHNITYRALERVRAGQGIEQAVDEVLQQYRAIMLATLQLPTDAGYPLILTQRRPFVDGRRFWLHRVVPAG